MPLFSRCCLSSAVKHERFFNRAFFKRIRDYACSDVLAVLLLALLIAPLAKKLTENDMAASYVCGLSENLLFYLGLIALDYRRQNGTFVARVRTAAKGLWREFALPEVLDLAVLRPLIIFGCVTVANHLDFSKETGLVGGGYVADAAFYTIALIRKK